MRLLAVLVFVLAACASGAEERRVLVVGDSVLAWNDAGVARGIASLTGAEVESRALSGAWVDVPGAIGQVTRFRIVNQLRGKADWVVVNGGANDLAYRCGCRRCAPVVNHLISRDGGSGALPDLWRRARAETGARVVIVGYYGASSRTTRFSGCRDALDRIDARAARFAAARDWAVFVDAGDVVTAEMLDADAIHPGPEGSRAIAGLVAGAMR